MDNKEKEIYETGGIKQNKGPILITQITCNNEKTYCLYNDGNLYEKMPNGDISKLDSLNDENKQIIDKIMENFKPGKIDVIEDRKKQKRKSKEDIIHVDAPEL